MEKLYHILNGDCLKEQFPKEIQGEIIICRECLVDGEVGSQDWKEFFQVRARFIESLHEEATAADYFRYTVSEFEKIRDLPEESAVCLWFEDDLFCQVNLWFTVSILEKFGKNKKAFLVRPRVHTQFGFGGLKQSELIEVYKEKVLLTRLDVISKLWQYYQNGDIENLRIVAEELKEDFPFIRQAVEAHIERFPRDDHPGRPIQSLMEIMSELDTWEFGPVFKEFNKRESIYGFGDLQVRRLFDAIQKNEK